SRSVGVAIIPAWAGTPRPAIEMTTRMAISFLIMGLSTRENGYGRTTPEKLSIAGHGTPPCGRSPAILVRRRRRARQGAQALVREELHVRRPGPRALPAALRKAGGQR